MERETLTFTGMFSTQELALRVSSYRDNGRLYVGLDYRDEDGYFLPYADLTVNLPDEPAGLGEAYIKDFNENAGLLQFVQKHRLGKLLPEVGHSGFCTYHKIAFDLDRLKELDRTGTEGYLRFAEGRHPHGRGRRQHKRTDHSR